MTLAERYAAYLRLAREVGLTPLSMDQYDRATRPRTVVFEPDFDIETEKREGWTNGHL